MKIYVSGPMTGLPQFNFPSFDLASAQLRAEGHEVFSPADNDRKRLAEVGIDDITEVNGFADGNVNWYNAAVGIATESLLKDDFNFIVNEADQLVLLPGWEKSTGARWERTVAEAVGVEIVIAWDPEGLIGEEDGWVFIPDEQQQRLTPFLRNYADDPTGDLLGLVDAEPVAPITVHDMLDGLDAAFGNIPPIAEAIERLRGQLAPRVEV